jgi:alkanesulfonate monooxygenase SsuD/methylene tetrahydromethanopterin reductase-like flavin-dependent oxidoreductase (luciferase family)
MQIGIGLPSTVLGTTGATLKAWAPLAEARGFSSLATIDRIAYPNDDSLISLAVAAATTERIGLLTNILVAPAYDPVVLAKQAATIDRVADGRFSLGVAAGNREDDYELTGRPFGQRGRRFDDDVELWHRIWAGETIEPGSHTPAAPTPKGRVPLLFGGGAARAAHRAVRWDAGYTIGGAPPDAAAKAVAEFKEAYRAEGGQGTPRVVALNYFSLGDEHAEESLHNLRTYYSFIGDAAEWVARGAARSPREIAERVAAFAEAGVDELILDPSVPHLDQVDRLADAVAGLAS